MTQSKRRARPKRTKEPKYVVHCGDAWGLFTYGGLWKPSSVTKKLNELLARIDFVPGLVFRDGNEGLFKPILQVHLVPAEPEES